MKKITAALLLAALLWPVGALAGSTVNPNIPVTGAPLQSAPMRNNFAAAATDINNILSQFANSTPPSSPSTFQAWMNISGCPTDCAASIFDGTTWVPAGILNQSAHTYSVALTPTNVQQTDPITVSVTAGNATIGLGWNSSLAVAGSPGTLGINLAHSNIFSAAQTVDLGTGSEPTPDTGAMFSAFAADTVAARYEATAFAATAVYSARASLGTRASPLTVTTATLLGSFNVHGYDGTGWTGVGAALHGYAEGTWSGSSHPGETCLATTPVSSTTLADVLCVHATGGATLGAPTGGDEGAGKVNVAGGYYINGAPIAPVSGGATGQILQGVTSSAPVWTATPTLGASGTLGTIAFGNATTGTITLQPVAGALGSSVLTMPAATDTLAVLAASQAFTNKTYNGLTVTTTTGTFTLTNAKTFSVSNSLTLAGTDSTTMTFPGTSATIARTDAGQTFTGVNNFTAPVIAGGSITGLTTLALRDTSAAFDVTIAATSGTTLTAGRTLTLSMGNVAHTLALGTTANTITFPNLASFTVITNGDTGTVTNAMLAGSIAASKLTGTDIATVGTLTAGATGAGFTVALTTSTITGNLPCANTPALSGNVTTSAGSCATTIAASVVTNSMLAGSIAASKLIGTDITTVGALGAGSATTGFTIAGASVTWSSQIAGANVTVVANASGSPSATFGVMKADGTTITCSSGTCSAVGGVATAVTVGTTTVNSGTTAFLLYNNGGTLGNEAATSIAFGTGTLNLAGNLTTTGAFNPTFAIPASVTYTFPGSAANLAALNITGQTLSGGANVTPYSIGTVSSGTTTISCGNGPLQYLTNGGAFTLAAPSNDGSCLIYVLNNGSAGAITFSGFTVGSSTGDSLTTTNTSKFAISIWRINGVASYLVKALQ